MSHISAVKYGKENEQITIQKFQNLTNFKVTKAGLLISHVFPWLGCSADGLIKNGDSVKLLEVKCPESCKDDLIENLDYLDENGNLKQSHPYYTQIQITAWISDCDEAILFIYSSKDYKIVNVPLNQEFV